MMYDIFLPILAAGVIAGAFGILFNIRRTHILFTVINGVLGYTVYLLSLRMDISGYIAVFLATAAMAVFAEIAARARKAPALLFLVGALVPILPGRGIFQFVLYIFQGVWDAAASMGIMTLLEAGGIALGVIIVSSVIKMIPPRKINKASKEMSIQ